MPWDRPRLAWLALSVAATAAPFLAVTLPPCVNLPQQVAQARLFFEALRDPHGPYVIQWLTPYALSYLPLLGLSLLAPPILAGKLDLMFLALAGVLATHALAAHRRRPAEAAALASLLVFSRPLYWGFLSFLVGIPVFLGWIALCARAPRRARDLPWFAAMGFLLYFAHALWLAMAAAWLVLRALVLARGRAQLWRLAALVPAIALAASRAGQFARVHIGSAPQWLDWPLGRLAAVDDVFFGGLRGPVEAVVLALLAGWLVAGLAAARRRRELLDLELLLAGALLLAAYLVLPDGFMDTLDFAQRWAPVALMLLLLAVPAPALRPPLRRVAVAAVAVAFAAFTTVTWQASERQDQDGLLAALDALPERPRVLGLDYVGGSELVSRRLGLQTFAWAQALHGGELNFSLAEYPASLVTRRPDWRRPWTADLEWHPENVEPRDLDVFDYLLVGATEDLHRDLPKALGVAPVTAAGRWRLYRVPR